MRTRHAPRLALALLERFVSESEALAGDLVEEFDARPSTVWFWMQVLAAIAAAWSTRGAEIRPLRLVDLQPADAVERARRLSLRFPSVNLSASPLADVGGLGLVILACLVTRVMPIAWWLLLGSALGGCGIAVVMIAVRGHRDATPPHHGIQPSARRSHQQGAS